MGMPITIQIADSNVKKKDIEDIYGYFEYIDQKFSTYKPESEISQINKGSLKKHQYSKDMKEILLLSNKTKQETSGYFDIFHDGKYDPSGLVKGWAIFQAFKLLKKKGFKNFYIDAGGDIQAFGKNNKGQLWKIGIRNPFNQKEIVKVILITNKGIATSGTYIRGQHIYNPHDPKEKLEDVVSMTVIGPNVYEADRFATSAFAMGRKGIEFIENMPGFEGYMIDKNATATYTSGFNKYVMV